MTDEQILDEASHHGFFGSRSQLLKFSKALLAAQPTAVLEQPEGEEHPPSRYCTCAFCVDYFKSDQTAVLVEAKEALMTAKLGLLWYQDMVPEYADDSDAEENKQIDAAIATIERTLGDTK
jgi:hypothetical protein